MDSWRGEAFTSRFSRSRASKLRLANETVFPQLHDYGRKHGVVADLLLTEQEKSWSSHPHRGPYFFFLPLPSPGLYLSFQILI